MRDNPVVRPLRAGASGRIGWSGAARVFGMGRYAGVIGCLRKGQTHQTYCGDMAKATVISIPSALASRVEPVLQAGAMYRIAYSVGTPGARRVSRSVVLFEKVSKRRLWSGELVRCLDFQLPHGRALSLLEDQIVDAREATQNDRGQWTLGEKRRRTSKNRAGNVA